MPHWLQTFLEAFSAEGAVVSALGGLTAALMALGKLLDVIKARKWALAEAESTVPPEPKVPATPEAVVRKWTLEEDLAELRTRLSMLDAEYRAAKGELSRTALALVQERELTGALQRDLSDLRRALDSGHTRLQLPASRVGLRPIQVVEVDGRDHSSDDTPPQGHRGMR